MYLVVSIKYIICYEIKKGSPETTLLEKKNYSFLLILLILSKTRSPHPEMCTMRKPTHTIRVCSGITSLGTSDVKIFPPSPTTFDV
jgi:hypothetical protein